MRVHVAKYRVHLPRAELWEYLSDYEALLRLATCDSRESGCSLIVGTRGSVGARYAAWTIGRGYELDYTSVLEDASPHDRVVWSAFDREFRSLMEFDLERTSADWTEVRGTCSVTFPVHNRRLESIEWELIDLRFSGLGKRLQVL